MKFYKNQKNTKIELFIELWKNRKIQKYKKTKLCIFVKLQK